MPKPNEPNQPDHDPRIKIKQIIDPDIKEMLTEVAAASLADDLFDRISAGPGLAVLARKHNRCLYCGAADRPFEPTKVLAPICTDCFWPIFVGNQPETEYHKEWWKEL